MAAADHKVEIGRLPKTGLQPARFLDVIPELPLDGKAAEAWALHGVTWADMTSLPLQVGTTGCTPSNIEGAVRTCADAFTQLPFQLADVVELTSMGYQVIPDADQEMIDWFDQAVSAAFAKQFAAGTIGHTLFSTATPPTTLGVTFASAAITPARALAVLETEMAVRAFNGVGIIHLPPGLLGLVVDTYGVEWVEDHWETPLGNTVLADAGYVNMRQPAGSGSAAGTLEDWVYATGPVWYRKTPDRFRGDAFESGNFNFAENLVTRWRETQGIIVFDPAYVTAVKAAY